MEIKNVKGTRDLIREDADAFSYVENVMSSIASLFAFKEARLPVMEYSDVFVRGVGESSDVVRKEMYTFLDKGDRSVTLRPEFTAGIMRLVAQNKLYANTELPVKFYYCGPVFRYERPQLGRYRQFNQFGVESIGSTNPYSDVDVILLAYTILVSLGLENVTLKINSLGDEESRDNYRNALKEYFGKYIDQMCEDCKSRYELNPLRILDCKVEEDHKFIEGAPKISDYLSINSKVRFENICHTLEELGIPYQIDDTLVRGLDYYSETVFEFHYQSSKGNNYGAIGAGGHYGKLLSEFGGPDLPGVGFSFGVDRLVSVLQDDGLLDQIVPTLNVYMMPLGQSSLSYCMNIATELRSNGLTVDICLEDAKLGSMFKKAEKKNADFAVIIGENEINSGNLVLKNLATKEQQEVHFTDLVDAITAHYSEHDDECCCGHHHDEEHECCHGKHEHDEEHHCCCHNKEGK